MPKETQKNVCIHFLQIESESVSLFSSIFSVLLVVRNKASISNVSEPSDLYISHYFKHSLPGE